MPKKSPSKIYVLPLLLAFFSPLLVSAQSPTSPVNSIQDIVDLFGRVLFWVSTVFWIVAGIATLYAGYLYLFAGGDQEKVGKAKRQLLYAVIATAIGILAAGLPTLVNSFLSGK